MLETWNLFRLKSQIYNLVVVKKDPTYIPAICLEELRETMEADTARSRMQKNSATYPKFVFLILYIANDFGQ
jgi:hypothetical protein